MATVWEAVRHTSFLLSVDLLSLCIRSPASRRTLQGDCRGSTPPPSSMEQGAEPQVGPGNTWDTMGHCCDVRGVGESDAFATASQKFSLIPSVY